MNTTTLTLPRRHPLAGRSPLDWAFAALVLLGAGYAFSRYHLSMDVYEKGILTAAVPALIALGWFWKPLRTLSLAAGAATLLAIGLYVRTPDDFGADLAAGEQVFWL